MTIQEIAEKAGVSTATVSRVFSHHPNIRPEVRKHVFAIAKSCGYHPRLSTKQRNVVVIAPYKLVYPVQSYVEMVMTELTLELSIRGYRIEILPHDNLSRLDSIQFCGAVSIGFDAERIDPAWEEHFAKPLIVIDRGVRPGMRGIFSIRSDEFQAMDAAVGHLASRGCRRIGCLIHGEPGEGNAEMRRKGVESALKKRNLPARGTLLRIAFQDNYVEEIGKLLKNGIDALFCPGGNAGIIAAYALSLYGRRIPEDIALLTSERTQISRYCIPPQTTISQDYIALAAAAVDALDAALEERSFPAETVIPYKLVLRDSA